MPAENTAHQLDVIFGTYMQRSGVEYNYIYNANLYSATCSTGRQRFTSKKLQLHSVWCKKTCTRKRKHDTHSVNLFVQFSCVSPL